MIRDLNKINDDQSGQALAEYSLVLSLVFLAVVAAVALLGDSALALFGRVADAWPG
jgi:Flp pilus assembly pilin Flp